MGLEEVAEVNNGSMEAMTVAKPTTAGLVEAMEAKNVTKPTKTWSASRFSGFRRGRAEVNNGSMEAKTVTKPTKTWSASRISGSRRCRKGQ